MSFLTRWFRKSEPEDYEQVLSSLASGIQKRETRLSEIRLRERRTTLLFTLYAIAIWAAYVSLWYVGLLPVTSAGGSARSRQVEKVVWGIPIFAGPIVILFMRRIVQIWYTRKGDAEEKTLKVLRKQQRDKVEEIKKKTNYYTTRNLIERYDDVSSSTSSSPGPGTPLRKRNVGGTPGPQAPSTPMAPRPLAPQQQPLQQQQGLLQPPPPQTPAQRALQNNFSPPNFPTPPPRKQWFDKLADALLGDEEASFSSPASRYALICERCFGHNGLVKEESYEDVEYVCPKCGHFNPSRRSRKTNRNLSTSPSPRSGSSPLAATPEVKKAPSLSPSPPPVKENGKEGNGAVKGYRVDGEGEGEGAMMEVDS
ncbi:hypothetical protein JAAARDRAFT_38419 [Jaapia argillacea MUCL 33604]|uniref:Endoplasmic reticulum junction formation protein lunapark n=1 Tax=Jaapia argillacea MUCL 33604 TaxID=933084 RepID=A0A067PHG7_9AGAM|nr:hypothetical protein JAAARDRAFT_38419 [Jaapia argillacea MUCL 33604]